MVLGLLTSCSMDQKSTNEEIVTEEVSWVLTYEKEQYSDEFDNPSILHEGYFEYDSLGRLISEKLVYESMNITGTYFEYDENANVVYKTGTYYDYSTGELSYSYTYTYDNNNNCIREFIDYWTSSTDDITYEYDEHGNVIKEHSVYTSDSGITETVYTMALKYENDICVQNEMTINTTCNGTTDTGYALKQYIYDDNGNKEKELYYTVIENKNDAKNPVQINGRYYKLHSFTEYTYKNLNDVAVKPNSDAEQSVETTTKINLSDSVDKVLASGYEANGDYYELVANESENYNGVKIEVGVIKNNEWILEPTSDMPFIDEDSTLYGTDVSGLSDAPETIYFLGNGCFFYENIYERETYETVFYNSNNGLSYEQVDRQTCVYCVNNVFVPEKSDKYTTYVKSMPNAYVDSKEFVDANKGLIMVKAIQYDRGPAEITFLDTNNMTTKQISIEDLGLEMKFYPYSDGLFAIRTYHKKFYFYNASGELVLDLSEYDLTHDEQNLLFINGECTFSIYNNQRTPYSITINKQGEVIKSVELK